MTTATIAEQVRTAHANRSRLRVRGAGTWLGAGRPVTTDDTISLAADGGIVEYVPGDLTLTARAGTRLSEIASATRAEGQWLPLDPWGGDDGTLGATLSTATAGPHAHATGLPRDLVLGMEFVNGTGRVIRSGGRVVKNVAGFDLTRMMVGSWGTLGIITEASVRLRALPDHARTLAVAVPTTAIALSELAARLRALPFAPLGAELLNASLATHLGFGSQPVLLVGVGGNERSVRAQVAAVRALGDARDVDDSAWRLLRGIDAPSSASWRWSRLPSLFGESWMSVDESVRAFDGALVHGSPMRGVVRVVVPFAAARDTVQLARAATAFTGTVVVESLPEDVWPHVNGRPASDPISRALRAKFDPASILNFGILGEESDA
jgi:glycolate oxidase FAD binding subunit